MTCMPGDAQAHGSSDFRRYPWTDGAGATRDEVERSARDCCVGVLSSNLGSLASASGLGRVVLWMRK